MFACKSIINPRAIKTKLRLTEKAAHKTMEQNKKIKQTKRILKNTNHKWLEATVVASACLFTIFGL